MKDLNKRLLEDYKNLIKEKGLIDELYKWKLVNKLKGKPDFNTEDFEKEIRSIYPQENNMVFLQVGGTAKRMAKFKPEKL
jgi:hypothetical protein